jgi:hypothetical protein
MIRKIGKAADELISYRPINLLSIMSKEFEKGLVRRLHPLLKEKKILPDYQFGFRRQHSTAEQIHRVANTIKKALEENKYCSAAFLDITQAFDKNYYTK